MIFRYAFYLLLSLWTQNVFALCNISSSQAEVNYGSLRKDDIGARKDNVYQLNERELQVSVNCDEPKKIAVFFNGQENENGFKFSDKGAVMVEASGAMLDGVQVLLSKTSDHVLFTPESTMAKNIVIRNNVGIIPVRSGVALKGKQFSITLLVKPYLKINNIYVVDNTQIQSDLRLNVESIE